MSDLIERLQRELDIDLDTARQGAGAMFSLIKERVGLRTFQMLRVPFSDVEEWIDSSSGIEGYGAGDYFAKEAGVSGPAVDIVDRATAAGVPFDVALRMFSVIYDAIQQEAIPEVAEAVAERVPSPGILEAPVKRSVRALRR